MVRAGFSLPLATALLATAACAPTAPALSPRAGQVVISDAAPPADFVEVGPVTAQSGKGCGVLGSPGSRPDAEAKLRAAADKLGASFVRITQREAPRPNHQCMEHEHKLSGVAYRARSAAPAPVPTVAAPPTPPPTASQLPLVLRNYEGDAAIGKPAPATDSSSVLLALVPGEPSGSALSVTCTCSGPEPRANLDVWATLPGSDLRGASSLTFRIKPDSALALSVSFMDGNHTGYTQQTEPLTPGAWQKVVLPLYKFWHNPFGPPGDKPGAPLDLSRVDALGFAPRACEPARFLIDDFQLE
jgi:hypothetical protein